MGTAFVRVPVRSLPGVSKTISRVPLGRRLGVGACLAFAPRAPAHSHLGLTTPGRPWCRPSRRRRRGPRSHHGWRLGGSLRTRPLRFGGPRMSSNRSGVVVRAQGEEPAFKSPLISSTILRSSLLWRKRSLEARRTSDSSSGQGSRPVPFRATTANATGTISCIL